MYSGRSLNTDGVNHIYSTSFSGDTSNNIPSRTLVGFEGLRLGGDLDYDDEAFVFTNMSVSPIQKPETYEVLLVGLMLIGFILRCRKTDYL